jgi:hypothetical protein
MKVPFALLVFKTRSFYSISLTNLFENKTMARNVQEQHKQRIFFSSKCCDKIYYFVLIGELIKRAEKERGRRMRRPRKEKALNGDKISFSVPIYKKKQKEKIRRVPNEFIISSFLVLP